MNTIHAPTDTPHDLPPCEHDLKVWPPHWGAIASGEQRVEIRWDDGRYQAGDVLVLREYIPDPRSPHGEHPPGYFGGAYTGNVCRRKITHVFPGGEFGLMHGYVALSLTAVDR